MLLFTAALGGILLAAGTAGPGYSAYAPAAPCARESQHAPAAQYAPPEHRAPAGQHPTCRLQPWSDPAVRRAAFEEPAPPRAGAAGPARPPAAASDVAPLPITPPGGRSPLPLAPPGGPSQSGAQGRRAGAASALTILGGLGLVLGLFLLTAWGIRRAAPRGSHPLPNDVFEVLGRAPLAGRQQAYLLRLGNKLVLVSLTPAGAETLTEIIDPMEVDRVAGLCRQAQPGSATAAFRQVFEQFAPRRPSARETAPIDNPSYGTAERYHG